MSDPTTMRAIPTRRHLLISRVVTAVAVAVPPLLYLAFVSHFAVNSLQGDEWNQIPFIHDALHGSFSVGQLWSQYGEPRIPLVRGYLLFFAEADHLDLRAAIVGNAVLLTAAYAVLLALFRRYAGGRLNPVPVLAIGLVWFSLADVQNALWAFEVGWYLVTLGFMCMLGALILPKTGRPLWLVVAMLAAVVATLAWIQGFVVWPVGLLCLLWSRPDSTRWKREVAAWCVATVYMVIVYFVGYDRSITSCKPSFGCVPTNPIAHPVAAVHFLVVLVGNVVPGGFLDGVPHSYVRFELVGILVLAAAAFIVVQSIRRREVSESTPLPLLLIAFSILFDLTLVWGRVGAGPVYAIQANRYVMPNVILLVAIVIYAWAHRPWVGSAAIGSPAKAMTSWIAFAVVCGFVVLQVFVATNFGIREAKVTRLLGIGRGQLTVNWNLVPLAVRECDSIGFFVRGDQVPVAAADRLGEFGPTSYRYFAKLGPLLDPACSEPPPVSTKTGQ